MRAAYLCVSHKKYHIQNEENELDIKLYLDWNERKRKVYVYALYMCVTLYVLAEEQEIFIFSYNYYVLYFAIRYVMSFFYIQQPYFLT